MKTFRYWYTDDEDFEYNVDKSDIRLCIKTLLSDMDKKSLIEIIIDSVMDEDLFDYFEDEIKDYFEYDAIEWYKENR